jgi:tyrosyl-tRNA synthetase
MNVDKQIEIIKQGSVSCLPEADLRKKLEKKERLQIKLGVDPTAPDLHLGHAVVLRKLKQLQDLGHEIVFLIGDYTARIGDPTGKSKTRPSLEIEDIQKNAQTYFEQVGRILDVDKLTIRYNSEWLKKLDFIDVIKLCSKITVARLLERDDFSNRMSKQQPVALHELLYPVMQGYDSVALKSDIELGGTDQTFNLLCGRFLQEQFGNEPQTILTMPLLEGLDGKEKMSKSLGNAIGLIEEPTEVFGKLMSISDDLMWRYFLLLLSKSKKEIDELKQAVADQKRHPMDLKKEMARGVVALFWSEKDAEAGQKSFETVFQKKDYSKAKSVELPKEFYEKAIWIVALLKEVGAVKTSSEARRLIIAGAVSIDGEPVKDLKDEVAIKSGSVIKVGKHRIYTAA